MEQKETRDLQGHRETKARAPTYTPDQKHRPEHQPARFGFKQNKYTKGGAMAPSYFIGG